jgi:hypothetical protein
MLTATVNITEAPLEPSSLARVLPDAAAAFGTAPTNQDAPVVVVDGGLATLFARD